MMIVLLYILIVILAFVFAVTINHTIVNEATSIGTLRAMGYSKKQLVVHYMGTSNYNFAYSCNYWKCFGLYNI